MTNQELPEFSAEQWKFLAVLEALGGPVSVEMAVALSPLSPGPLLGLLRVCDELKLIRHTDNNFFSLAPGLPEMIRQKINRMNSSSALAALVDQLKELNLVHQIPPDFLANLLARSGRNDEAAQLEIDLARESLENALHERAYEYFLQALDHLTSKPGIPENDALLITGTLDLSNLTFVLGKDFNVVSHFLEKAGGAAQRLGDNRSRALIHLHQGRWLYFSDRRLESMKVLAEAYAEVIKLADEDILTRAAEFLGLYFYMQGMFWEALKHFERALQAFESQAVSKLVSPSAPILMGYCAAYLGQVHRAVGCLDSNWRRAKREANPVLAVNLRAALGVVLLLINKKGEAYFHLNGAWQEAITHNNALARALASGGLAYLHFRENRFPEARELLAQMFSEGASSGMVRQYSSPWILEMIAQLDRLGYEPIPGLNLHQQIERILKDPSFHLRGTALRLRAEGSLASGGDKDQIKKDLSQSEAYFKLSGDPLQLAKTRIEMACLKLSEGYREEARVLAQKAREGLSGFWEDFFPDGLRSLLAGQISPVKSEDSTAEMMVHFKKITEELTPFPNKEEVLNSLVSAMNRFFGSERGGLFWIRMGQAQRLGLRACCNLSKSEVTAESFRSNLSMIFKSFHENRTLVIRTERPGQKLAGLGARAILCLPIEVKGQVQGVLYHDNSYLDDCFDSLTEIQLSQLAKNLSTYIEQVLEYGRLIEETKRSTVEKLVKMERSGGQEILTRSPVMANILAQADRVAQTDSTVLLQGETGVGKELLARRIHERSPRCKRPLITIDPATIPENLVESELFGFEKGAFTGADQRKIGRIEIAHQGTLFIDEVGEIPPSVQVKFLRVLQEKSFVRIGGTRSLISDFRLIAATNRNLAKEVAAGRFREDLYYRLNIVPLILPPLRQRTEDIPTFAQYFLTYFAQKYNRSNLRIFADDAKNLTLYDWPGNIRELRNVIERGVILASGERLELNLPTGSKPFLSHPFADVPLLDEIQRRYIRYVMEKTGGRISGPGGAAALLGMKRTSLYTRMKKLGMSTKQLRS